MKLHIKRKAISMDGYLEVKNQEGITQFFCYGSFIGEPRQFVITDQNQKNVGYIRSITALDQKNFEVEDGRQTIRLIHIKRGTYIIDQADWFLKENTRGRRYELQTGKSTLFKLRKRWLTWGDHYELEIEDEPDAVMAIGFFIVIDYMNRPQINFKV